MAVTRVRTWIEFARHSFWVLPAVGIVGGIGAGILVPVLDDVVDLPSALAVTGGPDTARAVLQVIVTVAVSVAGISFSVIVVALVLASQQLSPRVLRSFQRHPLNQVVLGLFLGTAAYALYVLGALGGDEAVPELSVALAMLAAGLSLILFVGFLHHMVRSLNASAVIRRIAADGHRAIELPYPSGAGAEPDDPGEAERAARARAESGTPCEVRAPRAGYLASVQAADVVKAACAADAFVEQRVQIGNFAVTGAVLANVWCDTPERDALLDRVCVAFVLNEERMVDNDVAFPIRQLADVALKGLSPGINDPTTSENAMDSVGDTLVRFAREPAASMLRVDDAGTPRLRATAPQLDDLVTLGFDQVRRDGARRPSFAVRLLELLAAVRDQGGERAASCEEIERQARALCEHACAVAEIDADRELIADAFEALHGERARDGVLAAS